MTFEPREVVAERVAYARAHQHGRLPTWRSKVRTSRVLSRYGDWVVTTYGIENTRNYYPIEKRRVHEAYGGYGADSWIHHMAEKVWCDIDDFSAALHDAQERW